MERLAYSYLLPALGAVLKGEPFCLLAISPRPFMACSLLPPLTQDIWSIAKKDLRSFSDIKAWYVHRGFAQEIKQRCSNPTSAISDEIIATQNAQIVEDDMVRVQVSNDDAAVAQRWLEDKVLGQEGAKGNVAEKKKVKESMKANLGKLLKYNAWSTRIQAKDSSGYCYRCLVKGGPQIEVPAQEMFDDDWGLESKEVSPLGEKLSLFDRLNEVERGRILEAHHLGSILQQQISQCMALSYHDGNGYSIKGQKYRKMDKTEHGIGKSVKNEAEGVFMGLPTWQEPMWGVGLRRVMFLAEVNSVRGSERDMGDDE
ncbi:hypothetical protein Tco_1458319 [Tanacetum coccineum]